MSQGEPQDGRVTFEAVPNGSLQESLYRVDHAPARIIVHVDERHATPGLIRHLNALNRHITNSLWDLRGDGCPVLARQSMAIAIVEPDQLPAALPCIVLEREGELLLVVRRGEMSPELAVGLNVMMAEAVGAGGRWRQNWGGSVHAMAS